jgi:hypothetical protein
MDWVPRRIDWMPVLDNVTRCGGATDAAINAVNNQRRNAINNQSALDSLA